MKLATVFLGTISFAATLPTPIDLDYYPTINGYVLQNDTMVAAAATSSTPQMALDTYTLSKRNDLDQAKMNYILKRSPKAVVKFKDTNTALVPDKTIIDTSDKKLKKQVKSNTDFTYHEVQLQSDEPELEEYMVPASPCLSFQDKYQDGVGRIAIEYQIAIDSALDGVLEGRLGDLPVSLALQYSFDLLGSTSTTFVGTYSCSTVNSTAVRLFYSPNTVRVMPFKREVVYNMKKSVFKLGQWKPSEVLKLITTTAPKYHCVYEDYFDLRCDVPESSKIKFNF